MMHLCIYAHHRYFIARKKAEEKEAEAKLKEIEENISQLRIIIDKNQAAIAELSKTIREGYTICMLIAH
jgi:multidrug resistance efflux pump